MTYDLTNPPDWFAREQLRFQNGDYDPVPWPDHLTQYPGHFLHLSTETPGNVAFTQSDRHGEADRQTTVKPGRYLTKYFPDLLSPEVARLAGLISAMQKPSELFIARTCEEIRHVYINGPSSCMSSGFSNLHAHPSEVYAGPDTAVAYIKGSADRIVGRTVIRTNEPLGYMRLYGDDVRLLEALESNGYGEAVSFEGCRLLRINRNDEEIIAPYVDGGDTSCARYSPMAADLCDKYLTLSDYGEVELTNTCGYVDITTCECSECESYVDSEDHHSHDGCIYCDQCYRDIFVDDFDGNTIRRDEATEVRTRYRTAYVHDDDLDANTNTCFLTNELWLLEDLIVVQPTGELASPDALDEDDNYQQCPLTCEWYHIDHMVQVNDIWIHKSKEEEACRSDRPLIKTFPDSNVASQYLRENNIGHSEYRYRRTAQGSLILTFQYAA